MLSIIVILAALILPRLADFRRDAARARNAANLQQVAAALERFTLDGHSLTNADSTETIVVQLTRLNYISPSPALTSSQIISVYTNGFIFFASTYDN